MFQVSSSLTIGKATTFLGIAAYAKGLVAAFTFPHFHDLLNLSSTFRNTPLY